MAMAALIVRAEDGVILILIAVVGPWVSDSGAYFAGRLLGRHAMFPSLSPKKTIEGGLGGLVLTMGAVGVVGYYALGLSPLQAALAGAVVSIFSQSGDLFESLLKRMMEIKDLGNTLPGHGGMLDRIDSLLFTAPAVYYIFLLI
jgi:phosphatidate cytidylyltransferase